MIGLLSWMLGSKLGRYVLIGGLAAAGVGILLLRVYSAGRQREKARQAEASLLALRERVKVNDEIAKLPADERRRRIERWVRD